MKTRQVIPANLYGKDRQEREGADTMNTTDPGAQPGDTPQSGADLMRQFLPSSPFVGYLSITMDDIQPGVATLTLPFDPSVVTIGDTVHGGAIASLIDTAAMVAAWSDVAVPERLRGTTVGMTVSYLAAANGEDLHATARVLRRGRSLVYLDVEVHGAAGGLVAKGLVTYKIG
jgi:uncharacterized protein (TIGR00369 family)